jgi:DNA-binding response OmpR family regulator
LAIRFRERAGALWRLWQQLMPESRTVLALTTNSSCRSTLRVLALQEGWRILFADSLEEGVRLQGLNRAGIFVYDQNLPGVEWRQGLSTMVASHRSVFPIVMTDSPSSGLKREVLEYGGFDLARSPLEPECFVALVRGARALARSIDSLGVFNAEAAREPSAAPQPLRR